MKDSLALALCVQLAVLAADQPLAVDSPLRVELGAATRAEPTSSTFELTADFSGKVYVWAVAEELDLVLVVEEVRSGQSQRDDGGGGAWTPCVALEVEPGRVLRVFVARTDGGDEKAWIELHAVSAPETDVTRAAAGAADESLREVERLCATGELAGARDLLARTVEALHATPGAERSAAAAGASWRIGLTAYQIGALSSAAAAKSFARNHCERTLPNDHPDVQNARLSLAATLDQLGDSATARELNQKVLDVREHSLPDEHPHVQTARQNLAITLRRTGDLRGALELEERVLAIRERTLADDDPELQAARLNLSGTLYDVGDFHRARELLERALEVLLRTLPDEHPDLQDVRQNLASVVRALGDLPRALELQAKLLAIRERTLPDDHPALQAARLNYAATLIVSGGLHEARDLLERVLLVFTRTLHDDHADLQAVRLNLASARRALGDLYGARELEERVLEVYSRTLPDDHSALQDARQNLANTIKSLGDPYAARELEEKVLEVRERTLADDSLALQVARQNLAVTILSTGDLDGARVLLEKVLEVRSRTLPEDHHDLQTARLNLAWALKSSGDAAGARDLEEQAVAVRTRTLPEEHPELQSARLSLACTLRALGDLQGERELEEGVVEVLSRTLPDDHPNLELARNNLLATRAALQDSAGTHEAALALSRSLRIGTAGRLSRSSPRELLERARASTRSVNTLLSIAAGAGVLEPDPLLDREVFGLIETLRSRALVASELERALEGSADDDELRSREALASAELARLVREGAGRDEMSEARRSLDGLRREALRRLSELPGAGALLVEPTVESLSARLAPDQAIASFWRYVRTTFDADQPWIAHDVESLLAFVVRADGSSMRIELGPVAAVEGAAERWRNAIGASNDPRGVGAPAPSDGSEREAGERLRALVLDPLLPSLEGVVHLIAAPDDVLHAVALDAMPAGENKLVGERLSIELRGSLRELLRERTDEPEGGFLVLGGASYGPDPKDRLAAGRDPSSKGGGSAAALLRGSVWESGFAPLPGAEREARTLAALWEQARGPEHEPHLLTGAQASYEALLYLAPRSRYVHLATHGWFASESLPSSADPMPLDERSGMGIFMTREEQVLGTSPMLLCGLALAGANHLDAVGRMPGLITAEEVAGLDLSHCELAVLSACDTNVGVRRAGQGVASLQQALHAAGARSVVTSLWKVPDLATAELMVDFYRRIWIEHTPKARALWEAKMRLREKCDAEGRPLYRTSDWAAWVLTGEP